MSKSDPPKPRFESTPLRSFCTKNHQNPFINKVAPHILILKLGITSLTWGHARTAARICCCAIHNTHTHTQTATLTGNAVWVRCCAPLPPAQSDLCPRLPALATNRLPPPPGPGKGQEFVPAYSRWSERCRELCAPSRVVMAEPSLCTPRFSVFKNQK